MGAAAPKFLAATLALAALHPHLTIGDFGFLLIGVAWVISLFREWKPAKALRDELGIERASRGVLEKRNASLEERCEALEAKYQALEQSRDFGKAFEPLIKTLDEARAAASKEHAGIVASITSLTTAVSALSAGINAGTITTGGAT